MYYLFPSLSLFFSVSSISLSTYAPSRPIFLLILPTIYLLASSLSFYFHLVPPLSHACISSQPYSHSAGVTVGSRAAMCIQPSFILISIPANPGEASCRALSTSELCPVLRGRNRNYMHPKVLQKIFFFFSLLLWCKFSLEWESSMVCTVLKHSNISSFFDI